MKISIFRQKQRFKIGMADKFNAEKVMGFPFMPIGALVDMGDGRYCRIVSICSGPNYNSAKFIKMVKIINCFQLLLIYPVNTCDGFNKKVLLVKNLSSGNNLFRIQLNIKMIAFGLIICFPGTWWSGSSGSGGFLSFFSFGSPSCAAVSPSSALCFRSRCFFRCRSSLQQRPLQSRPLQDTSGVS